MKLGVNIDHVATLRQARGTVYPDPVGAASICEEAGCDSIVAHLREDRRHINDADILRLRDGIRTRFNLEMSIAPDIVSVCLRIRPNQATLVPERRRELTTEGGLDVIKGGPRLARVVERIMGRGISVSLFIDPLKRQIDAARRIGVEYIEIHTGRYAEAASRAQAKEALNEIDRAANYAHSLGLKVNAGHGLNYDNVSHIVRIKPIIELNIGHSIIARAVFVGLAAAVREMRRLIDKSDR